VGAVGELIEIILWLLELEALVAAATVVKHQAPTALQVELELLILDLVVEVVTLEHLVVKEMVVMVAQAS
jgi:hypothetical protein